MPPVFARGVYQTDKSFISETYSNEAPSSEAIMLLGDLRSNVEEILGHPYASLRIRYWKKDGRSTWILDEIGKTEPITFGIVVKEGKIENIKVLAFREIRGWEVKYPAFTAQFTGVTLKDKKLDKSISGISGATLSVWAMTSVAELALYLDQHIKMNE
jgi:hypothetical protein